MAVRPTNDWEIGRFSPCALLPFRRERGSVSQPLAPFLQASDSEHIATRMPDSEHNSGRRRKIHAAKKLLNLTMTASGLLGNTKVAPSDMAPKRRLTAVAAICPKSE